MKKTIILIVYNRPQQTLQTLESLKCCHLIEEYSLLVVRQTGCEEIAKIIESIDWIPRIHKVTEPDPNKGVAYKINHNVRVGLQTAFEEQSSDYVVVVEDDVLLGYDFLVFCEEMHERYKSHSKFRGINAFSKEPYNREHLFNYGIFRYGIGQGWAISKSVWDRLSQFWTAASDQHFDALVEPWFRFGFVVMPYCSRSCNIGFGGSAHSPASEFDDYFVNMRNSWVGEAPFRVEEYIENKLLAYTWRGDCVPFKEIDLKETFKYFKWRVKIYAKKILISLNI